METDMSCATKNSRKEKRSRDQAKVIDEERWKELPEDLQEAIIVRLPIASLFKFRCVCKKWNSLLDSQISTQNKQPWFYVKLKHSKNGAVYDPLMKKWHLSSIPPNLSSSGSSTFLSLEASAGGLVCGFDYKNKSIHVGNPLTHTWKELPKTPSMVNPCAVGMILNQDFVQRGYQIVSVQHTRQYKVYDSLNNTWVFPGWVPSSVTFPLWYRSRGDTLSIGSVVYFFRSMPSGIVSYDTTSDAWEQLLVPYPPNSFSLSLSLAECDGRILLVGLVGENDSEMCVCVWELRREILVWTEVDRMPNSWMLELRAKGVKFFRCLGNTRLLLILMYSSRINRIFTYDVVSREWSKALQCVLPGHKMRKLIEGGRVFFPGHILSP